MGNATHGGKGDRQRKVNKEQYDSNFDRIFKQDGLDGVDNIIGVRGIGKVKSAKTAEERTRRKKK